MCQKKVKFCCPEKYVNIHIFSQLTWLSQTNCGWWRKTTYTFEFSVKLSIRIRYFSSCAKKKVKFCWPVLSVPYFCITVLWQTYYRVTSIVKPVLICVCVYLLPLFHLHMLATGKFENYFQYEFWHKAGGKVRGTF